MRRRVFVGAASLVLATGCPAEPPAAPEDPCNVQIVTLKIYASDDINPNENERPRPVVVRLYQLAGDLRMLNAKYDDILLRDQEVLGAEMMKKDEVEVFPNDLVEVKFERIPEAIFLAGTAMFRSPQGQSWKTFYEFPPMPNTPEACIAAAGGDAGAPQAFPETAFFVVERKIDNGSQFDESMFPQARSFRKIHLPPASAGGSGAAGPGAPGAAPAQ
jgi:type VI secretion system protein VasD